MQTNALNKEPQNLRVGVLGCGPISQAAHFYKLQIEGFADTILHRNPLRGADCEDGTAAIRALVAIARSVETGGWVRLADVTGGV